MGLFYECQYWKFKNAGLGISDIHLNTRIKGLTAVVIDFNIMAAQCMFCLKLLMLAYV